MFEKKQYSYNSNPVFNGRSGLFLLSYLLFLLNIVVGVVVGLLRMVVTALYNIIHMGRLDISLLNRGSEIFDPGQGYMNERKVLQLTPPSLKF